jgi:hypothetical protein
MPQVFQIADQDILEEKGTEIPDMGALIDRWPAGKDGHGIFSHGLELLYLSAEGIEEL